MKPVFWFIIMLAVSSCLLAQDRGVSRPEPMAIQRKLALVIGNMKYARDPLTNPGNDAAAMARELRELKFDDVVERHDLTRQQMEQEIDGFARRLSRGDLALFYYAGHGVQDDYRQNYLVPVDFRGTQSDLPYNAYSADKVREALERSGAKLRVIILDSCRKNTFRKASGRADDETKGLAPITKSLSDGTLIAYAAADDGIADDGEGTANGLYTGKLLEAMRTPGLTLRQVFDQTKESVYQASQRKQQPAVYNEVIGDFYFLGPVTIVTGKVNPAPKLNPAVEAWELIKGSKRAEDFDDFVEHFPDSELVPTAKLQSNALRRLAAGTVKAPDPATARTNEAPPALRAGESTTGSDGLLYVWIPPGSFTMGCSPGDRECFDDEKPVHARTVRQGFWIGQTPVTVAAWKRNRFVLGPEMAVRDKQGRKLNDSDDLPAVGMTWNEAKRYCQLVGGRLPTEVEWEYAARAGTTGSRYGNLDDIAWYGDNSGRNRIDSAAIFRNDQASFADRLFENGNGPKPVQKKQPNAWRLYDILGNVLEWTADWYDAKQYSHIDKGYPTGPGSGDPEIVVRGGAWTDGPRNVRVSNRVRSDADHRGNNFGLRCVVD